MKTIKELLLIKKINHLKKRGGYAKIKSAKITSTLTLDSSSSTLDGGTWSCNTDPNGVFASNYGTKLKCANGDFPLLKIGANVDLVTGSIVKNVGFQGNIVGMDTRQITDFTNPERNAGIVLDNARTDQCEFYKLSFCGLSSAVCVTNNAEVDANIFEKINADGCGNSIYFSPLYSYYTRFTDCICADNPYYGFYAKCNKALHNLILNGCHFVRNAGGFTDNDGLTHCAVFFDGVNECEIKNCLIDAPGVFWYYDDNATSNDERQPSTRNAVGLQVNGNKNRICDNTFLNSTCESIIINGDGNVLLNNIVDGTVIINGKNNYISNLVFTNDDAKLILKGDAISSTKIFGISDERIIK